MKKETIKLSVNEAVNQGYTTACDETGESSVRLSELAEHPELFEDRVLYLGSKETFNFSISEKEIEDMIEQHITNQDVVNDESEVLYTQIGDIDYKSIAELVNKVFITKYYSVTEIELVP